MTKNASAWLLGIGILAAYLGIHVFKNLKPSFHFGAVANSMDSTSVIASIGYDMTFIEFEVKNEAQYGYIDLVLDCTYIGASGSAVGQETMVIYDRFSPESLRRVTVGGIDTPSQSTGVECVPDDATLVSQINCIMHLNDADEVVQTCSETPLENE